jgi:hypothetical protein
MRILYFFTFLYLYFYSLYFLYLHKMTEFRATEWAQTIAHRKVLLQEQKVCPARALCSPAGTSPGGVCSQMRCRLSI